MPTRILIVDDSKTMRDMLNFTLTSAGYEVIEAEDGQQALKVMDNTTVPYSLVITDLNMPNMDGISLIKAIRIDPHYKAIPILMLTTEGNAEKKMEGKAAGATGWMVKPFNPEKLVEIVRRLIG